MAQDRTSGDEPLWAMLWQLEDVASALHEQVDDLLDGDSASPDRTIGASRGVPRQTYYTERYGLDYDDTIDTPLEPSSSGPTAPEPWHSSPLESDFDDVGERITSLAERLGLDVDVDDHGGSDRQRAPSPASFRRHVQQQDAVDGAQPGRVTSSFHNVVYGLEAPVERENLRELLERRAFDELWVQGADADSDRFIEFFAAEGFGETQG